MNMNDGDDANNLLITGATVLTGNDNREIIEGGAVAISAANSLMCKPWTPPARPLCRVS